MGSSPSANVVPKPNSAVGSTLLANSAVSAPVSTEPIADFFQGIPTNIETESSAYGLTSPPQLQMEPLPSANVKPKLTSPVGSTVPAHSAVSAPVSTNPIAEFFEEHRLRRLRCQADSRKKFDDKAIA
ncbi:MAG: hypothetical protein LQ350_007452 [Teloschistes chrysophthalmus]|nr:MAG: hypothetical protein LQ350_007452 [Niorma chrysophthalma]